MIGSPATANLGFGQSAGEPAVVAEIQQASLRASWVPTRPLIAFLLIMFALAMLPGRSAIPPLVTSDYCYQLLAADRLHDGFGLTSLQPVAPGQPWTWQYDWGFLTKWPIGFSLVVAVVSKVAGFSTMVACQCISIIAVSAALVGWFLWIRRTAGFGIASVLIALVGSACAVPISTLLNPSTDAIVVAVLPYILLLISKARECSPDEPDGVPARGNVSIVVAGLLAGGLFWIRYASLFVPLAVLLYFTVRSWRGRRLLWRPISMFAFASAIPIISLLLINRAYGAGESIQQQLNLGHHIAADFTLAKLGQAWWRFTDFGFYDHHAIAHWIFALWPVFLVVCGVALPAARITLKRFLLRPPVGLSVSIVVTLLGMLVVSTALFGEKFDYVGLERYYLPIRPLYFLLFVAPVVLIPRWWVRATVATCMVVAASWIGLQDWKRSYERSLVADREITVYGRWARAFSPHARELYSWLGTQDSSELIIVSNFHEFVALETGLPTLPIPKDRTALDTWIEQIRVARNLKAPRILFVLDPDNRWRDYWIDDTADVIRSFELSDRVDKPSGLETVRLFEYRS